MPKKKRFIVMQSAGGNWRVFDRRNDCEPIALCEGQKDTELVCRALNAYRRKAVKRFDEAQERADAITRHTNKG